MGTEKQRECMFCGQMASTSLEENFTYRFVECPVCGRYNQQIFESEFGVSFKNEIAAFLYHSDKAAKTPFKSKNFVFLGSKSTYDNQKEKHPYSYYASEDEIKAFYPKNFSEQVDAALIGFAKKSEYVGKVINYTKEEFYSAIFIKQHDKEGNKLPSEAIRRQFYIIKSFFSENEYVKITEFDTCFEAVILPNGWKRVDEIQKQQTKNSNTVFIAMSFSDKMKETRETIKKSIIKNGLIPRIMDEIEHNHQIVPEMLYEIRQSKFVIAELTGHNNGAYFEAGYALGIGKEVIQVCNKNKFDEDGHFDVKQINTVMWESQDDLLTKLDARIKATIS